MGDAIIMIERIVESAFQTQALSVVSEGLICQVIGDRAYNTTDLILLQRLIEALEQGKIQREAKGQLPPFADTVAAIWRAHRDRVGRWTEVCFPEA